MTETERLIRPSSLPKLAECTAFEGKPGASEAAKRGTRLDAIIRRKWHKRKNPPLPFDNLPEPESKALTAKEDVAAVTWAIDTMTRLADGADIKTRESHLAAACPVEGIKPGTMDALCVEKSFLIDFKTGQIRNYREQMAAYALACMDAYFSDTWTAYLLFVDEQVVIPHEFTEEEARAIVEGVAKAPIKATTCEYCSWCAKFGTCSVPRVQVAEVVEASTGLEPIKPAHKSAKQLPPTLDQIAADDALAWQFLTAFAVMEGYCDVIKAKVKGRVGAEQAAGKKNDYFNLVARRGKRVFPARGFDHVIGEVGNIHVLSICGPASEDAARKLWADRVKRIPFPEDIIIEQGGSVSLNRRPAKQLPKP